jgi:hypothetical protein
MGNERGKPWSLWDEPWFLLILGFVWATGAVGDLLSSEGGFSRFMDWVMLVFGVAIGISGAVQLVRERKVDRGQPLPPTR